MKVMLTLLIQKEVEAEDADKYAEKVEQILHDLNSAGWSTNVESEESDEDDL